MRAIKHNLSEKEEVLICAHWKSFPPQSAFMEESPEILRNTGAISEIEYQQHLVYTKVCGLKEMHPLKCLSCPYVRKLGIRRGMPHVETLDGKFSTPLGTPIETVAPARIAKS